MVTETLVVSGRAVWHGACKAATRMPPASYANVTEVLPTTRDRIEEGRRTRRFDAIRALRRGHGWLEQYVRFPICLAVFVVSIGALGLIALASRPAVTEVTGRTGSGVEAVPAGARTLVTARP